MLRERKNNVEQVNIDARYYQLVTASIKKDGPGAYRVRYRLKDSKGDVIKESSKRGFSTQRDAKLFIEKLKHEHGEAMFKQDNPTTNMTFAELYERYRVSRIGDKPSTVIDRESIIKARVMPFFKDMLIGSITQDTIAQWHSCFYDESGRQIFSDTYLRSLHSRLSAVLNYAVYCGWLASNPAKKCSIGAKNAPERPVWDIQEYSKFRKEVMDEPDAFYAFETLYFTGLRKGELLALTVGDMDFDTKILSITKSMQVLQGREVVTSPKTKMSVRKVRINDSLADEIKEYIDSRPGLMKSDRLFPINKNKLAHLLKKGTQKAGLHPITIHCFRHSHITNLIAAGYSPADIAKRVGHESIYITLHYSHAFKSVDNDIANSLDAQMEVLE